MIKSEHLHVRLHPKTMEILDFFSKERGIRRSDFLEDTMMMLSIIDKSNPRLKEILGSSYYEKYFKN